MKDLTEGNLSKNLFFFALPSMISGFFSYALNAIDQMMLGKLAGDAGLSAAGCTSGYFSVICGIIAGLSLGFGIRLAYLVGSGDNSKTRQSIRTNVAVTAAIAFIVMILSLTLWSPIFKLLQVPSDLYVDARRYFLIYSLAIPTMFLNDCMSRTFASFGNSVFPMRVGVGAAIANVILNFLFIVVCKMGASGAALASVFVSYAAFFAYSIGLMHEYRKMECETVKWHFSLSDYAPIWRLAFPCLLQQVTIYIASFALQPSINTLGTSAIAAISVGTSISTLVTLAFQSTTIGLSIFVGQAIGHGRISVIRRGILASARQIILLSAPFIALLLIFPRLGALLFLADPYGESAAIVIQYMYYCVPAMLCIAYARLYHNFFRGVMRPSFNAVASASQSATRIIVALVLIPYLGYLGLFIANGVSWLVDLLVCLVLYWSKRWKAPEYLEAEASERAAVSVP